MTAAPTDEVSEEAFLASVAELCAAAPELSQIGAALLLALHLGICSDSRTFARLFGIEHALVLRDVTELADAALITIVDRNARTQRTTLALTGRAETLLTATP